MNTTIQVNYDNRFVDGTNLTAFRDTVRAEFNVLSYTMTPSRVVLFFDGDLTPYQMARIAVISSENGLGVVQKV